MISYYGMSKLGTREKNEDSYRMENVGGKYIFALADGLGGHKKGEVASRIAVETSVLVAMSGVNDEVVLDKCFIEGQRNILEEQKRCNLVNDMKTTQVVLYINNNKARWAHVGDSRIYRFKTGLFSRMIERSIDHSVVQNMALTGQIKEKDIRFHEDRNVLLRVMGIEWDSPKHTIDNCIDLNKNESFLLCTDGFWEWIDEKQMLDCLKKSSSPQEWLKRMEQEIIKKVGNNKCDNYTAIAVFIR